MKIIPSLNSILQLWKHKEENTIPREFLSTYESYFTKLKKDQQVKFSLFRDLRYDMGDHPESYVDYECAFASKHIQKLKPKTTLDIGSYRHFIIGLLSHFHITTLDFRTRKPFSDNETIVTCDAKELDFPDNTFDVIVSLCALEHFGLGRYGDEFDIQADTKAIAEMIRVLKPNGHLIITTTLTRTTPVLAFNAHRIYTYNMIQSFFTRSLLCKEELFYSNDKKDYCSFEQITEKQNMWDIYCGCWQKK